MNRSVVAISSLEDSKDALNEVVEKIRKNNISPNLILFTSNCDDFYFYTKNLHEFFPESIILGTTSYINFNSEGLSHHGISAFAICDGVECSCGVLFEVSRFPKQYMGHIKIALDELSSTENTCCVEFCTAFSNGEELVLDTFEEVFENRKIQVFGSSSGNCLNNKQSMVSLNGECYQNSCVFAFIHNLEGRIFFYKENLYKPMGPIFSVTDIDVDSRTIYEFDDKPAADVIASALKIPLEELGENLCSHPMGRIIGNKLYITESDKIFPDGSISYFSQIYNRTKMALLEVCDFDATWEKSKIEISKMVKKPSFSIVVNCSARSHLFEKNNRMEDFNKTLTHNYGQFFGISGYGEQIDFLHLNQTMIIALFE